MDGQRQRIPRSGSAASSLIALPEYIINSFIPGAQPLLAKYPTLFRCIGFLLAFWYLEPVARLQAVWSRISALIVATVEVASDEDLFGYMTSYLYEKKTLRANQTLSASSNPLQDHHQSMHGPRHQPEESPKSPRQEAKVKYERSRGTEFFFHKRRLFWASRAQGEGHLYFGNRYRRSEVLSISCLGRATEPIQELLEDVFRANKAKEETQTIIRRPHTAGYSGHLSWSRLTSKPRRALNTVVLDATKKAAIVADIQEYMEESTAAFYGSHGIPYRRGYMFYGPPGTGKTSFALALASKFNMDVYVISLLDQAITDSDLVSLFNQLPGRSLLLLEDIDTAGLSKRKSVSALPAPSSPSTPASRRSRGGRGPGQRSRLSTRGAGLQKSQASARSNKATARDRGDDDNDKDDDDDGEDDQQNTRTARSQVSLSGLLNAIDGVAAPEGHILIITTNKPYNLDDALVRAGRISVRVAFTNATKNQAEELFARMYVGVDISSLPVPSHTPADGSHGGASTTSTTTLDILASKFAAALPDQAFSPADLQDYLLSHKKDPLAAVQGVSQWIAEKAEEQARRQAEIQAEREKRWAKKSAQEKEWVESIKTIVKETNKKAGDGSETDSSIGKAGDEDGDESKTPDENVA